MCKSIPTISFDGLLVSWILTGYFFDLCLLIHNAIFNSLPQHIHENASLEGVLRVAAALRDRCRSVAARVKLVAAPGTAVPRSAPTPPQDFHFHLRW
jgi:hypothetical protein